MLLCVPLRPTKILFSLTWSAYTAVYLLAMQKKAVLALRDDDAMTAGRKSDKDNWTDIGARNCYVVTLPRSIARVPISVNTAYSLI